MRLYLSSTLADLKDERQAVKEVLGRYHAIVDSYEAAPRPLWASCVDDVASCDLYVGIVGLRYGFVPPGQHRSITELEFEAALAGGLNCYVFVKDEKAAANSLADHFTRENDPALIEAFRARLFSGADGVPRVAMFKTPDELKVEVLKAVPWSTLAGEDPPPTGHAQEGHSPPPPPATTELQKLLWQYLQQNWPTLSRQQAFTSAKLLSELAAPLSPGTVFELARSEPAQDVLLATRRFFIDRGASPWASASATDSIVCSAWTRIALVAAERYVRKKCDANDKVRTDHDPMLSPDQLVACIEAATRLGFGLCFSGGKREPDNVFQLVRPLPEPGVRNEEGLGLWRSELWEKIERRGADRGTLNPREALDEAFFRGLIRDLEKEDLGTGLVVSSDADGPFAKPERRAEVQAYLKDDFGVRSFFRQPATDNLLLWVREIEAALNKTFEHILTIASPEAGSKEKMMPETPQQPVAATRGDQRDEYLSRVGG